MQILRNSDGGVGEWLWRLGPRRASVVVTVSICLGWAVLPALVGLAVGRPGFGWAGALFLAPAIATPVIGVHLAMPAVRARSIHRAALGVAIASIFASAPVVLVGIALPYIPQAAGEPFTLRDMLVAVASIVPLSLIGIVLFGWMALPLAIPSGYLWAAVLRAVFRERLQTLAPDMFAPRAAA